MEEKKLLFVVVLSCLLSTSLLSQDLDHRWIHELNKVGDHLSKAKNEEAFSIVKKAEEVVAHPETCRVARSIVDRAQETMPFKKDMNKYPDLLIFVSFSMPVETIKSLALQAKNQGGKIVFRGLLNGSFKEMGAKLQELGVEALIDPTLFQKHKVTQVPTFIQGDDRLVGHVSLSYVLKTFGGGAQ